MGGTGAHGTRGTSLLSSLPARCAGEHHGEESSSIFLVIGRSLAPASCWSWSGWVGADVLVCKSLLGPPCPLILSCRVCLPLSALPSLQPCHPPCPRGSEEPQPPHRLVHLLGAHGRGQVRARQVTRLLLLRIGGGEGKEGEKGREEGGREWNRK